MTVQCKPCAGDVPDVPGEDQTPAINQRTMLGNQFSLKFSVQEVTLSVEVEGILRQSWQHKKGSIEAPVTRSLHVYMGPVDNPWETSYWIETDLSHIWAFKSCLGKSGARSIRVAKLAIQATSHGADGMRALQRVKGQGWWLQMPSVDTVTGYFPIEAISIEFGKVIGFVAVMLQNQCGDKKILMHCSNLPTIVLNPAATWEL